MILIINHQVASLASCFVPCEKSSEQIRLRSELSRPMTQLQEAYILLYTFYFHTPLDLIEM
jgi:hypothetical protein